MEHGVIRGMEPQRKSPTRHEFRERVKSREIQPGMRFTPHLPMERVVEMIERGNLRELDPKREGGVVRGGKEVWGKVEGMGGEM